MYMYDHQFMESDLIIKRHDSYSWYRFWTIKALVEAVVSNDAFSVIFRGMVAPLIIARLFEFLNRNHLLEADNSNGRILKKESCFSFFLCF